MKNYAIKQLQKSLKLPKSKR